MEILVKAHSLESACDLFEIASKRCIDSHRAKVDQRKENALSKRRIAIGELYRNEKFK